MVLELGPDGAYDTAASHTHTNYKRWDDFKEDDIDFTLPMFDAFPADQREAAAGLLSLPQTTVDALPDEQAAAVRSFRTTYQEQLRQRVEQQPKKPFEEAAALWRAVVAAEAQTKREDDEARRRETDERVSAAMRELGTPPGTESVLKRTQRKSAARARTARAADRRAQFAALRELVAP